jgi:hypothetical protein
VLIRFRTQAISLLKDAPESEEPVPLRLADPLADQIADGEPLTLVQA